MITPIPDGEKTSLSESKNKSKGEVKMEKKILYVQIAVKLLASGLMFVLNAVTPTTSMKKDYPKITLEPKQKQDILKVQIATK